MSNIHILYPAIAMFSLTIFCVVKLGLTRFFAVRRKEVSVSFFSTYSKGTQPPRLHLLMRHVQNHFEVPPLFYIAVVALLVTHSVSRSDIILAWLFVGSRLVHTLIHLGHNNVSQRFFVFGFGLICLCGLWGSLFVAVMQNAG